MSRVLIAGFCAVPGPDRVGVQLSQVIRALAPNHQVDALVVRRGDQAYVEKMAGARILRVPVPEGSLQGRIDAFRRALCRQLEGAEYDVVHFRDGWAGVPVLDGRERLKYAAVFDAGRSPRTEIPSYDSDTSALLERDERRCIAEADAILVATEPARQYLSTHVDGDKVHMVPPGVDVDAFDWDEPAPGPPTILFAGSLLPGRGVRVLLRAMLDVAAHSDARLALVGKSNQEFLDSLRQGAVDLNISDRVTIIGEVPHTHVPGLIASATVCVAPSAADLSEDAFACYPTKILEYLACQRAVVAAGRGTVNMVVRDQQHVLTFEPGQPRDLAEKLLVLLQDKELRARIARAGYDLVRRVHTASAMRRALRRAYSWLASISPWRERFAESMADLQTGDAPALSGGDPTGPGVWVQSPAAARAGRSLAAFDGELLDDLTSDNQVDTGMTDGIGDVTRVEEPMLVGDRGTGSYEENDQPSMDDWVVEDSRIRGELVDSEDVRSSDDNSIVDGHFVAGELEIAIPGEEKIDPLAVLDDDATFTAMSEPLGVRKRSEFARGQTEMTATVELDKVDPDTDLSAKQTMRFHGAAMPSTGAAVSEDSKTEISAATPAPKAKAVSASRPRPTKPTIPAIPRIRPTTPSPLGGDHRNDSKSTAKLLAANVAKPVPKPSEEPGGLERPDTGGETHPKAVVPVRVGTGEDTGP